MIDLYLAGHPEPASRLEYRHGNQGAGEGQRRAQQLHWTGVGRWNQKSIPNDNNYAHTGKAGDITDVGQRNMPLSASRSPQ